MSCTQMMIVTRRRGCKRPLDLLTYLPDAGWVTDWSVEYRPGGWARARSDGMTAYLKLGSDTNGRPRLRVNLVTVVADKPLTEAMWRRVPLAEIEMHLAMLSSVTGEPIDKTVAAIKRHVDIEGFSAEALERYFETTEPLPVGGFIPARPSLSKPPDGRLTDDFLSDVARMYLAMISEKRSPGPAIAEAAGVPVRTVHRWVAEARSRGILPRATRGKAG